MKLHPLKPRKALNKAYLKVKPNRTDMERFKAELIQMLDRAKETESEEFHKNLVSDFLKKTWYEPNHFINTKGRNDLVIHNGNKATHSVGVIVEAKKPSVKAEMPSLENLNKKAFHELILYYLRERIQLNNLEVKHLVITNLFEWFIFDVTVFERLFAKNSTLLRQFQDFEAGRLADTKTDFFYKQIAEPFVAGLSQDIEFAYFNLNEYSKPLRNKEKSDDHLLIALYKLLSPEHLLKKPFVNDSNSLDKRFYTELLHIIGLTEVKDGGKKLIQRHKAEHRQSASLLEDTIIQLESLDKINRLERPSQYGATQQERLFNVALELSITWVNRILFLKLLEAQLVTYQKGDKSYAFLNSKRIKGYDDLNTLFFQVLAKTESERNNDVKQLFEKVPYLNSSLFEPTELEHTALFMSNLRDDKAMPLHSATVLKDEQGKKRTGTLPTLQYLFAFLDAYDFSSEGSEDIQEDNKVLINASVLGLIFEKINGYKDGSFFTPGFITMYMCRETIRRSVVQKFNETKGWNCSTLDDLYDKIEDRKEANQIVNSVKICDPAVGSGHFLVSALNEMIAVKNDLKILADKDNRRLKEYHVAVVNDELTVTDDEGQLFEYKPAHPESQRIQETLFHEKQTIIENCLFGVDINPNSVKICRLRLWIELLKNAYFTPESNYSRLETLPNIDINIKCGNSLVSRFAIDADLKQALKKSKYSIDSYRAAVSTYRNAQNKDEKREMERIIGDIKSDFRSEITRNDPKIKKLYVLNGELVKLTTQQSLFEMSTKEKAVWSKQVEQLTADVQKLEIEIETIKANKIFENAFEWRFEFPEVLDENGAFIGFDVVIGNPPYIRQEEFSPLKPHLLANFTQTGLGTADLFVYFVELAFRVMKQEAEFAFIIPNKWMRAGYGKNLRKFIASQHIHHIIDFGDLPVFEEATTYPNIVELKKSKPKTSFAACNVNTLDFETDLKAHFFQNKIEVQLEALSAEGWTLTDSKIQALLNKIKSKGIPLGEYVNGQIYRGLLTGLNEAFVIDQETRDRLIVEDPRSAQVIKPFLAGRDIKRYKTPVADKYLILFPKGFTIKRNLPVENPNHIGEPPTTYDGDSGNNEPMMVNETPPRYGDMPYDDAWEWLQKSYPAITRHLLPFKEAAEKRTDKGDYWWELRACDYYDAFEKPKIIIPAIAKQMSAAFDTNSNFSNDKTTIIPTNENGLIALLNSKLVDFYVKSIASTKQNGYYEYKPVYMSQIPVIKNLRNTALNVSKATEIDYLGSKTIQESDIDRMIFQFYDLDDQEIILIEMSLNLQLDNA
jgi:adenine-specific DNA-methyltransferase